MKAGAGTPVARQTADAGVGAAPARSRTLQVPSLRMLPPPSPRLVGRAIRHARIGAALAAVAVAAGGCMPQASTSQGRAIGDLYTIFFAAATVVFVIVAGLITWSIFRYRHRGPISPTSMPLPPQYHGNMILEAIWTALPILTVIGLFAATLVTLNTVQARAPGELNVKVTAFQWQWRFDYTDAGVSVAGSAQKEPQLVVPVGRPVHVTLIGADVAHAFFVPAFLFKQDAIPGHPNTFNFTVQEAGVYRGQCAEFCGVYHDRMLFSVRAVAPGEFEAWLAQAQSAATTPPAAPSSSSIAPGSIPPAPASETAAPSPSQ